MRLIEYVGYAALYAYCIFGFAYFVHKYYMKSQSGKMFILEKDMPSRLELSTILALTNILEENGIQSLE